MSTADPQFADKLKAVPLLRALVPLMAGIIVGQSFELPLYVWITAAAVCAAAAWIGGKRPLSMIYVYLAVFFFGAAAIRAHSPREVVPRGQRVWIEARITENPTLRGGRYGHTSAAVSRWRTGEGAWTEGREKLLVSFDTVYRFLPGERVVFRGYVNPVGDSANSYVRLMRSRGYAGRTHISEYSRVETFPAAAGSQGNFFKKIQRGAVERLRRLDMGGDEMAVAAAMAAGERSGITPALRDTYARTGAVHLLSVSGVHVAMVFMLVNAALYLLPAFRRGHIAKNVLAVMLVWGYAALTGLEPPAARSAMMFTGAQAALAMSSHRSAVNILCGTAFVMLALGPGMLFDISFQLSFISVAAIAAWFGPLYRRVQTRWRALNALWASLIIALVATAATAPLVSHTFGIFSPAGIVLSPIVMVTSWLVLLFSLVWILIPAPFLAPLFGWLIGVPAWFQNKILASAAAVPGVGVEYSLPRVWMAVLYVLLIVFTIWLAVLPRRKQPFTLPR